MIQRFPHAGDLRGAQRRSSRVHEMRIADLNLSCSALAWLALPKSFHFHYYRIHRHLRCPCFS